ncbi:NADPH:quinone oxidoreductase family protein [Pseudomarimonas arenosa]|uniref:NADPH:quinone oxidoreductase family protein n=1 Tax=Pseudomarimonas arenosa TaxID=2774145 RepID=A0AAW3ZRX2_9GAMM|nr:NADPH:quinone oxidoreductase family protein [Pseudomarimonas arenosa]MBD8527620.1 NADPH:quinone oxidoreductase family protein [Pseudomarimonas arenosa]
MQALVCHQWGGPELLQVQELPAPQPGPGQISIRVRAASLNFPDLLMIQNKYQVQPALPFVPGAEIAGEILAVGEGVQGLQSGMSVAALCGTGGFAEQCVVDAAMAMPLPPGTPMPLAASLALAFGTSWHALRDRAALQAGETVLVLGAAGGVGLAAVGIAKAIGARVLAAVSSEAKAEVCRQHGADEVVLYEQQDLRQAVKAFSAHGVDVVFDAVGGKLAESAFRSIAWRGRYLVIGFASGEIPALPWNLPLLKGASIVGVFWGEFARREPRRNAEGIGELLSWIQSGKLRPEISRVYSLADAAQAFVDMAERRVVGKVVIAP